jgi:uncharacterized SAM-binding protein YcdF (DUF218 family)
MSRLFGWMLKFVGAMTLAGLALGLGLMIFAGSWMRVNDQPRQADYIIPLAGDSDRLITAAELYNQRFAPVILLSNAKSFPSTRLEKLEWQMGYPNYTDREYCFRLLGLLGIDPSTTESFGKGHISTIEEAEALRAYLNGRTPSLLLVTSPSHARRAKMIFQDVLPGCRIMVTTSENGWFGKEWWKDQAAAQNLILEFAKTIHYLLGGGFRSTDGQPAS